MRNNTMDDFFDYRFLIDKTSVYLSDAQLRQFSNFSHSGAMETMLSKA